MGGGVTRSPTQQMKCPKCGAAMRTHRRNAVTIEQCTACHGIFLDRGELERLISAESSFLAADPPPGTERGS